jgi:hypothetical protein
MVATSSLSRLRARVQVRAFSRPLDLSSCLLSLLIAHACAVSLSLPPSLPLFLTISLYHLLRGWAVEWGTGGTGFGVFFGGGGGRLPWVGSVGRGVGVRVDACARA